MSLYSESEMENLNLCCLLFVNDDILHSATVVWDDYNRLQSEVFAIAIVVSCRGPC